MLAYLLCYKLNTGLSGLWYGWIIGIVLNTAVNWMKLVKYQNSRYIVQKGKK